MNTKTTDHSKGLEVPQRLLMSLELGSDKWMLGFLGGGLAKPRVVGIPAGNWAKLDQAIEKARGKAGLSVEAVISSCYEAGRDGFWVHRVLTGQGIENQVVDSSSIERGRRSKEQKTDRIDAAKLVEMLWRHYYQPAERKGWSVVRVPAEEDEDARQEERERITLTGDRTRISNRITSLLATQGIAGVAPRALRRLWKKIQRGDGGLLLPQIQRRIQRLLAQLELIEGQLRALRQERRERLRRAEKAPRQASPIDRCALSLMAWRGIGDGGWVIAQEFGWRQFGSVREVGAAAGLTGCHWRSGRMDREQGLVKSGNPRVRWMMIQLAWGWLRYQPDSPLTRWFYERFGQNRVSRKKGIVAVARKLLIALWKFWTTGEVIEGAHLKPAKA